ncbi:hypothetical protein HUG10_13720 [Halorarum halophilum]|uniref:Uncharacterized protein n=1 Tax=Halorarum halophilum TaxID=2743090 RepID=A0A7D5K249_9EURY|nr:hypothetical protein [Halobaculum halophilum]QLG28541.1 hypothetical protein HUG10_13720 [Halobaculum halophilum]
MNRRRLLAMVGVLALPGCSDVGAPSTVSSTDEASRVTSSSSGATCEPGAVFRPSPPEGTDPEPSEYPKKPGTLSADSVATYLSEFETTFGRNRAIDELVSTSVDVEIQGGFEGSEAGDGYVASSNVQVMFTTDADGTETAVGDIKYVANYYVDPELVYRHQTDIEPMDPRDSDRKLLVQCGSTA